MNQDRLEDWATRAVQWMHCVIHERTHSQGEYVNRQQDGIALIDEFDLLVAGVEKICLDDHPLPDESDD
jgi:hypothetical protein